MKKIILSLILAIGTLTAFSQEEKTIKFSAGALGAFPGDGLVEDYTHAIGGIGQMIYTPTKRVSYVLTTGYIANVGKRGVETLSHVPALIGVRLYAGPVYAGLSMGTSLYNKGIGWKYTTVPVVGLRIKNVNIEALYLISTIDHLHGNLSIIGLTTSYYF